MRRESAPASVAPRMKSGARDHDIRVGQDTDGYVGMPRAKICNELEAVADADACQEGPLRRGLDHRPVGDGIGEGNPDLDHVRACRDNRVEQARAGLEVRIAEHQERAERAFRGKTVEHVRVAAHASSACA